MNFTQLSTSEFKLESTSNLCLNAQKNCMVLIGNSFEIIIFELMYSCGTTIFMPYASKQVTVPQDKPLNKLLRDIDLVSIYENSNALETQELALDPIYVAECSLDPLKSRVLQADVISKDSGNLLCILTTYGLCEMFEKNIITGEWNISNSNLSNILYNDIFPPEELPTNIKTLADLKKFISKYIITSFSSSRTSNDTIVYLGTAAGYVVALKYRESCKTFEKYYSLKTNLYRITYITNYHNQMILVCDDQGKVSLATVNNESQCLKNIRFLWSKADSMACKKALINYCEGLSSYLIIISKSAHVLAYLIDVNDGNILTQSRILINGIKITGMESISENEFIITTIMGSVKYIKVVCCSREELHIEQHEIVHDFDSSNYQILGVAASSSKNLWSFLLYRNKEYVHQSKFSLNSIFLNVCKLSFQDSFKKLTKLNLQNMNIVQDLVMAISLDIFNNIDVDKYVKYLPLEELKFPKRFNDAFLQMLQIKLIITRKFSTYQKLKLCKIKTQTEVDLQFLEASIQLLYILSRLQYLKRNYISDHQKFSSFQELSISCMQSQFTHLVQKVIAIEKINEENRLNKTVEDFLLLITDQYEIIKYNTDNFSSKKEFCVTCDAVINNFEKCDNQHNVKRCSISYTQISLYKTMYCPHCYSLARNDEIAKLDELFPSGEDIKCTFCRFLLKQDDF